MRYHRTHRRPIVLTALCVAAMTLAAPVSSQTIPSPEEFFGHVMGADRQLARWDRLVEYYELIGESSDRVIVENVGLSTLGNPFLVIYVSSPENLARLEEIREMNAILSDPRGHTRAEIERAIAESKVVFLQGYALHSTEVAASQSAAEIMYLFATRDDEGMQEILDETVSIIVPGMNPDGNHIVTDWYNQWVGTEYEGSSPPELYHHYIGHDNNRDAFMQNTVESQYVAQIMFRDFVPQAFIDHHQMGAYTARIYLPPYAEPIRPGGDPLVWREMDWYGGHMALKMDEQGLEGAIGAAIYSGWGHFGFHWITPFHNIAGMLTESASARLATPLYVHPDQLTGSRQLPEYEEQTTFPNPWMGGWWHVRDIVDRQVLATFSPLELAAQNRETVLRNAYNKAMRQTERGRDAAVKAYVIPADQHDRLTMQKMVNKLILQGITVERASRDFTHEGRAYESGSYIVSMAQPKQGVVRWLLGQTYYPDNPYTRDRDGDPIRPYDVGSDSRAERMGGAGRAGALHDARKRGSYRETSSPRISSSAATARRPSIPFWMCSDRSRPRSSIPRWTSSRLTPAANCLSLSFLVTDLGFRSSMPVGRTRQVAKTRPESSSHATRTLSSSVVGSTPVKSERCARIACTTGSG